MPDERVPRMYGITCQNCERSIRLGKELLLPDAPVGKLRDAVAGRHGNLDIETCPICNAGTQFVLEDVRLVDDAEPPPENAEVHF